MASLNQLGLTLKVQDIRFTSMEESAIASSTGENYWIGKLLNPISIRSSMDATIPPVEVEELYLRVEDVKSELWEGNTTEGLYIPGYKADLSISHGVGLYQSTTIREWAKSDRKEKTKTRKETLMDRINKAKGITPKAEVTA